MDNISTKSGWTVNLETMTISREEHRPFNDAECYRIEYRGDRVYYLHKGEWSLASEWATDLYLETADQLSEDILLGEDDEH